MKRYLEVALSTKKDKKGPIRRTIKYNEIREATNSLVTLIMSNKDELRGRHLQLALEMLLFQAQKQAKKERNRECLPEIVANYAVTNKDIELRSILCLYGAALRTCLDPDMTGKLLDGFAGCSARVTEVFYKFQEALLMQ